MSLSTEIFERLDNEGVKRNRFLKGATAVVFTAGAKMFPGADKAVAQHIGAPQPCWGYPQCHYCDGSICYQYCWYNEGDYLGCPGWQNPDTTKPQWWQSCLNGARWRCRDHWEKFPGHSTHACLCRVYIDRNC